MESNYAPAPVADFLDPDHPALFPRLTPEQIEYLAEIGTQLTFARGDLVFEHGQRNVVILHRPGTIRVRPEGTRSDPVERPARFVVDFQVQHVARDDRKEQIAPIESYAAEHGSRRDVAERKAAHPAQLRR